jgi:hypothetical protein
LSKMEVEELDALEKRSAARKFTMDQFKGWVLDDL